MTFREIAGGRLAPWLAGALLICTISLVVSDKYYSYMLRLAGINLMVTYSLNLLMGYTGQAFVASAALFATGAYTSALTVGAGVPFALAWPLGGLLAGLIGVMVGLTALRLSGAYLAMVTLGFNIVMDRILIHWSSLTGGPVGVASIPAASFLGSELGERGLLALVLITLLIVAYALATLVDSQWGRALQAIRESELAARSLGIDSVRLKGIAFLVSSIVAGLAGGLYSHSMRYISPDIGTVLQSILYVLMLLLGGMGTALGPPVGTLLLTIGPEFLKDFQRYHLLVLGGVLLTAVVLMPEGLVGAFAQAGRRRRKAARGLRTAESRVTGDEIQWQVPDRRAEPLKVSGVCKRFGGLQALTDVGLTVTPGTVHGLIGPNGSGKSTLVNVISGIYAADAGEVRLGTEVLVGFPAHRIARLGVVRTFQNLQLFPRLTVLDNIRAAQFSHTACGLATALVGLPASRVADQAATAFAVSIAARLGLDDRLGDMAIDLPQGDRRRLEIARALATRPRVLLLDEPAAGLSSAEIETLCGVLLDLRSAGLGILVIEHHMDLIMRVCDEITVLDSGRVIAYDLPAGIQTNRLVQEAYLGRRRSEHVTSGTDLETR